MKANTIFYFALLSFLLTCCTENSQINKQRDQDKKTVKAKGSDIVQSGLISDKITYHPEQYEEDILDTILNQEANLRLVIKNYNLMDKGIDTVYVYENGTKERVHFRHNAADISLMLDDSLIYSKTFTKENLPNIVFTDEFGKASMLNSIWLSEYDKKKAVITLFSTVCVPDSDWCNFYKIFINKEGKPKIVLAKQT